METNRQKKIAGLLQEDLGDILGRAVQSGGFTNLIISVTKVSITVDLTLAKVYLSVFPNERANTIQQFSDKARSGTTSSPSITKNA